MAQKLKNKYVICCELLEMCNLMSIEIGYYSNDTKSVVNHLSNEPGLSHLKFLKTYNPENINIKTELTDSENEKINALFKILGTTDSDSMLDVINSFSKSIEESKEKYLGSFKSHSRLYIAFGDRAERIRQCLQRLQVLLLSL